MAKKIATLFRGRALKQLRQGTTKTGGRNNHGRITSFHRGGGAKRAVRQMDMKRSTVGLTGTVERIEYDPFRTGRTALIRWDEPETDDARKEVVEEERGCGRVRDLEKGVLPRGIRDLGRREAREVVATICGVPVVERKARERVMVTIDGRRKFSSSAVDLQDGFHQESSMNTERAHCAENFNNIVTKIKNSTIDMVFRNAEGASCGLKVILE